MHAVLAGVHLFKHFQRVAEGRISFGESLIWSRSLFSELLIMCSCTAACVWRGWLLFARRSSPLLNLNAVEMKIKHIPPGARTSERPLRRLSIISELCRCSSSSHPHDIIRHSPTATRFPGKARKNVNASVTYVSIPFPLCSPAQHRKTRRLLFSLLSSQDVCAKPTPMSAQWLVARVS